MTVETIGMIAVAAILWAVNKYGRRIDAGEARFDSETGKLITDEAGDK